MLNTELQKNNILFVSPSEKISIKPIILGVILIGFLITLLTFNQTNDVSSTIMLSESVECGQAKTFFGWRYIERDFFQGGCPRGWFPL